MKRRGALKVFGWKIRSVRMLRERSQEHVARRARITRSYLCRIERGRVNPSLLVLLQIAKALGVQPRALL